MSGPHIKGVTITSGLPPSVEAAYYKKCIMLRRRISELELQNDDLRIRQLRVDRAILKMRLERSILLDQFQRTAKGDSDNSDLSDSPLPIPTQRPLRAKRGHRRVSSPVVKPDPSNSDYRSGPNVQSPERAADTTISPIEPLRPDEFETRLGEDVASPVPHRDDGDTEIDVMERRGEQIEVDSEGSADEMPNGPQ